jgi:peroxiredoxin Q/BCP
VEEKLMTELKEGDLAPEFDAPASTGASIKLADFRGQYVVLYFYPRDNTPGCTLEACAFRDQQEEIQKLGAVVLGVSTDGLKAHDKFTRTWKLNFPLLADEEKKIVQAYGVWKPKKFMGREFLGTVRATFIIGPDGRLRKIFPKVSPLGHAKEVRQSLEALRESDGKSEC